MSAKKQAANSLAIALMVLVVLVVMVVAVGILGSQHLNLVKANLRSTTAVYAAEAGIAAALVELKGNPGWSAGFQNVEVQGEWDPRYSVSVTNNDLGGGVMTAPDGTEVPAGCVYLLATGTCQSVQPRRVAVMLTAGGGAFRYVIASGGNIDLSGHGDIRGSIKSNGDIAFKGSINIIPDQGSGRVIAAYLPDENGNPTIGPDGRPLGNIIIGSNLEVEPGQDVRARYQIDSVAKVIPAGAAHPFDTSSDTLPFGPTFNDTLPDPDRSVLLATGGYVQHPETSYPFGKIKTLQLGGQIHYFPNGLTMDSGSKVEGPGTIVVGNGNSATFNIPLNLEMNVIAVDKEAPEPGEFGQAKINFGANTTLRGLVYSHGSVEAKAQFDVEGYVICFGDWKQVQANASVDASRNPDLRVPGFEKWFGGGGGSVQVMSWQRL